MRRLLMAPSWQVQCTLLQRWVRVPAAMGLLTSELHRWPCLLPCALPTRPLAHAATSCTVQHGAGSDKSEEWWKALAGILTGRGWASG